MIELKECNKHIISALDISRQLMLLADNGEKDAEDDSCIVLYSIIRDCAYKIREYAEKEREIHIEQGVWDE